MTQVNEYHAGDSDKRPWGRWAVTAAGDGYAVKQIEVAPGHTLSLQKHEHRAEHWVIVQGRAEVTVDGKVSRLGAKDAVYIPQEAVHRIANVGDDMLVFIEVQVGDELRESDIERLEDQYGRE